MMEPRDCRLLSLIDPVVLGLAEGILEAAALSFSPRPGVAVPATSPFSWPSSIRLVERQICLTFMRGRMSPNDPCFAVSVFVNSQRIAVSVVKNAFEGVMGCSVGEFLEFADPDLFYNIAELMRKVWCRSIESFDWIPIVKDVFDGCA